MGRCTVVKLFCSRQKYNILFIFSTLIFLTSFILSIWLPPYVSEQLQQAIRDFPVLKASDQAANNDKWHDWAEGSDVPTYYSLYIFNISNPEDIARGLDPIVQELGPFTFLELTKHVDNKFEFDEQNRGLLHFREWQYYQFLPEMSTQLYDFSTRIYTPNFAFQLLLAIDNAGILPPNWDLMTKTCFSAVPNKYNHINYTDATRYFTQVTVGDLLFGYVPPPIDCLQAATGGLLKDILPGIPGLLGNSTLEDTRQTPLDTIYTGENAPELTQTFVRFRGEENLYATSLLPVSLQKYPLLWGANVDKLGGVGANRLDGTSALQFHPFITENERLRAFIRSVQRTITLLPVSDDSVHGIPLKRYEIDPYLLLNTTHYALNQAYDQFNSLNGFTNQSRTQYGLPLALSRPHFLQCDPLAQSSIQGFHPSEELHETFLSVETRFGVTMKGHKRIQLNMQMKAQDALWPGVGAAFPVFPPRYVPILWGDEHSEITSSKADDFKSIVFAADGLIYYTPIVGTAVGCVFATLSWIVYMLAIRQAKRRSPLDSDSDLSFHIMQDNNASLN